MTFFHTIAVPHKDILEGRLTMDVWAANLWEVFNRRGPDEYKDSVSFFKKTYLTQGLETIMNIVGKRLKGEGGDSVIQLKTPFGGGKTHALIALYHKYADAKRVVMVGTEMSATEHTPWGMLEQQLTGKVELFKGRVSPGGDAIRNLLSQHQPVLILIDELLEYITKAAGVAVEQSVLSDQVMAFMQEITQVAPTLDKVVLMLTLPASVMEHFGLESEKLFAQLHHVTGRVEKIYTPVQESEIASIIRQRLFSSVDMEKAEVVIKSFMSIAEKENFLPEGMETSDYRKQFQASYPFLPEVINVLYHRWGSFPNFQRTRGVLRLLSLVIHSLKSNQLAYITLGDFNLENQELRHDLLRHIGQEYDSVIASDISSTNSGSKKVDVGLGDSYKGLKIGTRASTTIFMYSFSGAAEQGATVSEIKRASTTLSNPSGVVSEALDSLKQSLFYLQNKDSKYAFTNQPNLNRVLLTKMENLTSKEIESLESDLLGKSFAGKKLKTQYLTSNKSEDVSDGPELKLIVLSKRDDRFVKELIERKGSSLRVYRNTLFFLTPVDTERLGFENSLKTALAWKKIHGDTSLNLSEDQKTEVKTNLKDAERHSIDMLRRCYRLILVPTREGLAEMDLGIGTFGEIKPLDEDVFEKLKSGDKVSEKIAPLVIKKKYLEGSEGYVFTEQLYQSSLKTPGEMRTLGRNVWESAIEEGVKNGLFGLGELVGENPICRYFKKNSTVAFTGNEILLREEFCKEEEKKKERDSEKQPEGDDKSEESGGKSGEGDTGPTAGGRNIRKQVHLGFKLPKGKVASLQGILNLIQHNFQDLHIEIVASNGEMTDDDYDTKILDAFEMMGVEVKE